MASADWLGEKLGPLPIVGWVGLAAGAVAIGLALRGRFNSQQSGVAGAGIDMLAPSAAEAFGTLEQQQSDLTNALSALGMGVSNVQSSVNDTRNAVGTVSTQVGQVGSAVGDVQGSVNDVRNAVGTVSTQVTGTQASMNTLASG
jgi:hypothetical protein